MNTENKQPETAADVVAAIEAEQDIQAAIAFKLNKSLEAILEEFCTGLNDRRALYDFYEYEIGYFNGLRPTDFPVIFGYTQYGCSAYSPSYFGKCLFTEERMRYQVARHGTGMFTGRFKEAVKSSGIKANLLYIDYSTETQTLIIEPVNAEQADNVCKDMYLPWYEKCKALIGLPTDLKMGIEFNNISFSRLRQLLTDSTPLPQEPTWYETPKTVGESLRSIIHRIRDWDKRFGGHKYALTWSERDETFYFSEYNPNIKHPLCGGIVYHGSPAEGWKENGSVQMERTYGWSMHT